MSFRVLSLLFLVCSFSRLAENAKVQHRRQEPGEEVSPKELLGMLKAGNVLIIDVRNPYELGLEGKIAGSVNIPLPEVNSAFSMSNTAFQAKYKIPLPSKTNCNMVFHCKGGVRSLKALKIVQSLGWSCARHLTGGFDAWKKLYP